MSIELPSRGPNRGEQLQFTKKSERYGCFLANTDQKAVQRRVLEETLQAAYPNVWRRIVDPQYDLGVLFAGAGPAESEVAFSVDVKNLRGESGLGRVSLHYEDVSDEMYREFRAKTRAFGITNAVRSHSLKKFEDPTYIPPEVDLTLGFQMWYYVGQWGRDVPRDESSLVKFARSTTKKDGVSVLSVQSERGDLHAVRGKRIEDFFGHKDLVAEEVVDELERLGLNFQTVPKAAETDVTSFFQNGRFNPTTEGKNIISFMVRKSWDEIPPQQQREIGDVVTNLTRINGEEKLIFRDTYIFIPGGQEKLAA